MGARPIPPAAGQTEHANVVGAARQYDPGAVGHIFETTFDAVLATVLGLLGDRSDAEAAAVRVYVRLLDRLQEPRARTVDMAAWLGEAAYREASRRRPHHHDEGVPAGAGDRPYDPRRVRSAFWALPDAQRVVLALRIVAGVPPAAIAAVVEGGQVAVLGHLERGLQTLAETGPAPLLDQNEALDTGIQDVISGREPQIALEGPPGAGLAPLLEAARAVRTLAPDTSDPLVRARVRGVLLSKAAERRALWVHAHQGLPPARHVPKTGFRPLRAAATVVAAGIALALGVGAAGLAALSEPDSSLYGLKRAGENALVAVYSLDASGKAGLQVRLAQMRLREAEAMAQAGKPNLVLQAVRERYNTLRSASQVLSTASHDAGWRSARTRLLDEENVDLGTLEQQLTSAGYGDAAARVREEVQRFQADRRTLDVPLGVAPGPSPSAPAPSQPSPGP